MILNAILEAAMLVCFGLAWPLANLRMLRTGRAEGRGMVPAALVLCGYVAGMAAKLVMAAYGGTLPVIFWMYALNACSVGLNLFLQWHLSQRTRTHESMIRVDERVGVPS